MPRKPTDEGPRRSSRPHRTPRAGTPAADGAKPGFRKGPAKFGPRPNAGPRPEFDARPERPMFGKPRTKTSLKRPARADLPEPVLKERERIAKVIARAGLGSRREIEEWIEAGRVAVNGELLDSPAFTVSDADRIEVDGQPLPEKERTRLFLFHKPRGLVTTTDDPEGRPTVFDVLPAGLPRLVSVGRLDFNTEGLLLLTNDGGLARVLELPETGWLRRYRVRAFGEVTQDQLDKLREGVEVEGMQYGPIEATLDREQGSNVWITVALREGKKREIRTVLGALGVHVNRLIRVSFGPFQLSELTEGAIEEIKTRVLREQLGEQLAALAGVDFDAPVRDYSEAARPPREAPTRAERPGRDERSGRDDRPARGRFDAREERGERRGRPERSDRPLREPSNLRKPSIWRAPPDGDAPLMSRLPRRERQAIPPASEDPRPKRRGQTEDRKGRSVVVERIASPAPVAAPNPAETERPFTPRGDRPDGDRPFKPRGDRPFTPRGDRPDGDRPFKPRGDRPFTPRGDRPEGDRPFKPLGDRPFTPRGDRPEGDRPFKPRGDRPFTPRGDRPEGDRPFKPRGDRPFTPRGDRPDGDRPFKPRGDRPFTPRGDRPEGDRPFKPRGDRPFTPRGDRPEGDRPFKPRGDRPFTPRGDRPEGDRPFKPRGDRPFTPRGDRPEGDRPFKPRGDRPFTPRGDRPEGDRPFKPRGDRPFTPRGDRPEGDRPFKPRGDRPEGDRPFKPRGDRPFTPRGDRPEGDRPFKPRGDRPFTPRGDRPSGKFGGKPGGRPGGKPAFDKPRGPRRPRPE